MVKSILVARAHDGLPLASTIDDADQEDLDRDFPEHKAQAKTVLLKYLPGQTEPRCTIEAGSSLAYNFHVYCPSSSSTAFIALCDRLYPKKLAYACLEEAAGLFGQEYSSANVQQASRPYQFIKFTNALQKCKRSFKDVRARQNIDRLQQELSDISTVMTANINQLLERGSKLESMSLLSSSLASESKRYHRATQDLNWNAFLQKYGVVGVMLIVLVLVLFIYFKWLR